MSNLSISPIRAYFDTRMTQDDIVLLGIICSYTDEDGYCFPGLKLLSIIYSPIVGRKEPYDISSISKKISRLEEFGYIVNTEQRKTDSGSFKSNRYKIMLDSFLPPEFDRRKIQASIEKASVEIQASIENLSAKIPTNDPIERPRMNISAAKNAAEPTHEILPEERVSFDELDKPSARKKRLWPIAVALSAVCRINLKGNEGRLLKEAQTFAKMGATPDEITKFYSKGQWWYEHDWRGKKGQLPTPDQIRETWDKRQEDGITQQVTYRMG